MPQKFDKKLKKRGKWQNLRKKFTPLGKSLKQNVATTMHFY